MKAIRVVPLMLLAVLVTSVAFAYMAEGTAKGPIIVVGEDRIAVQTEGGGQMTFEVAQIKDGDHLVANKAQLAQIKTLKPGDVVQVKWGKDHADHYYIIELNAQGKPALARNGVIQGKVVTAGEGRIVVAAADGAQMTLEPAWIRRQGKWGRDPDQEAFANQCRPGEEIVAVWQIDEGTHYVMRGVARVDAPGQAAALALAQAQMRETAQQVNQLQDQVGQLRGMLDQLIHAVRELQPKAEAPAAPPAAPAQN